MIAKLNEQEVRDMFEEYPPVVTAAINLFKMVVPHFDKVVAMNHYPRINVKTSKILFAYFAEIGDMLTWMNYGFSSCEGNEHLKDWEVEIDVDKIEYIPGAYLIKYGSAGHLYKPQMQEATQ